MFLRAVKRVDRRAVDPGEYFLEQPEKFFSLCVSQKSGPFSVINKLSDLPENIIEHGTLYKARDRSTKRVGIMQQVDVAVPKHDSPQGCRSLGKDLDWPTKSSHAPPRSALAASDGGELRITKLITSSQQALRFYPPPNTQPAHIRPTSRL